MIKVILRLDCGVGMSSAESYLVSTEAWDAHQNPGTEYNSDTLAAYAWEAAVDFAESYGIYPMSAEPDDYDEDSDDSPWGSDQYSEDISGWFELYDPEEHDGLRVGNGDWEWREL